MKESVHYRADSKEWQQIYKSSADFPDGALCGNGSYIFHLKHTRNKTEVTCPECIKKLRYV